MSQDAGMTAAQPRTTTTHLGNGLAIAGLVCGLVGLLVLPIVLGPLAVVFGGVALSRANRGAAHKGMSIAAIVLGAIDIIVMIVVAVAVNS